MMGVRNGNLSNVLEEVHLGHLLENFQREKITFRSNIQVIFRPNAMFRVDNRNTRMQLRLECLNFGSYSLPRKPGTQGCSAPDHKYLILKSVLESYPEDDFNIKDIASLLSVSESTVYDGYDLTSVSCSLQR